MATMTSEDAQLKICWMSIEAGTPYLCFGADCMAWERESTSGRTAHDGDITPHGVCTLLEARLCVAIQD